MARVKASVLGGDLRQRYLIKALEENGITVSSYGISGGEEFGCESLESALSGASVAILPFPLSTDGIYLNAVCKDCNLPLSELFSLLKKHGINKVYGGGFKANIAAEAEKEGLKIFDYGESEPLLTKNALLTAEGTICIAIRETSFSLHGSLCTVIGYGRIGSLLAKRLHSLGARVRTVVRRRESMTYAECDGIPAYLQKDIGEALKNADIVINTAPSPVLRGNVLASLPPECLVIDLASRPGGVDFEEAKKLGIKVIWALSLPGKYSPESAAYAIVREILPDIAPNEE